MQQSSLGANKLPQGGLSNNSKATLYFHIPFCLSKCFYCSFNSHPVAYQNVPAYMKALQREIEHLTVHPWSREREFVSLYIGGGTPTINDGEALAELIGRSMQCFSTSQDVEITVEANPNTIDLDKLAVLKEAGVTRLSIGIQSFDDRLLAALGRSHNAAEGIRAVELAGEAGFENVSFDLIYGLPGQTEAQWRVTLQQAIALHPKHISLYELMVEDGTVLADQRAARQMHLPHEDRTIAMQEMAETLLQEQGLQRYEISNYSKPGFVSRHNIYYWRNRSYLAFGAGAVSCLSGLRTRNIADPKRYAAQLAAGNIFYEEVESLGREARFRETVIMGLRMISGIQVTELEERFNISPVEYYGSTLLQLQDRGLISLEDGWLRLTRAGLPVANQVLSELV